MQDLMMMLAGMGMLDEILDEMLDEMEGVDTVCPVCGKERTICGADFDTHTMNAMVCTECKNIVVFDKDGKTVTLGIDGSIAELVKETLIERGEVIAVESTEEATTEKEMIAFMAMIDSLLGDDALTEECDCESCDRTDCMSHPSNK